MRIIIPLAGPDYLNNGEIKGRQKTVDGNLLESILRSRPWYGLIPSENYKFVFLDKKVLREFFYNDIKEFLPKSSAVFLSETSKGAALSVMSCLSNFDLSVDSPLLIDLADISFHKDGIDYSDIFNEQNADILIHTFRSFSNQFSFAEVSKNGNVINIKEKELISNNALIGTYFFKSFNIFIKALHNSLYNFNDYSFNGLLYISPILNYLISEKYKVRCINCNLKDDFSSLSHTI